MTIKQALEREDTRMTVDAAWATMERRYGCGGSRRAPSPMSDTPTGRTVTVDGITWEDSSSPCGVGSRWHSEEDGCAGARPLPPARVDGLLDRIASDADELAHLRERIGKMQLRAQDKAWNWLDEPKVEGGRADSAIVKITDAAGHPICTANAEWLKGVSLYPPSDEVPPEPTEPNARAALSFARRLDEMEEENNRLRERVAAYDALAIEARAWRKRRKDLRLSIHHYEARQLCARLADLCDRQAGGGMDSTPGGSNAGQPTVIGDRPVGESSTATPGPRRARARHTHDGGTARD